MTIKKVTPASTKKMCALLNAHGVENTVTMLAVAIRAMARDLPSYQDLNDRQRDILMAEMTRKAASMLHQVA